MRLTLTAAATSLILLLPTAAQARSSHASALQRQQARYAHANGYLWAIHRVAFRTVNSPKPSIRARWRRDEAWLQRVRRNALLRIRALTQPAMPPHHDLWVCISQFEGGVRSVNPNGHYGLLQMSYNWLGYIRGRASDYSRAEQEWAAEKAYADRHFSRAFLYGQWFDYDGAAGTCLPNA